MTTWTNPIISGENDASYSKDSTGNVSGFVGPGGVNLGISETKSSFPKINLARGVVNTFKTALGANSDAAQMVLLEECLSPLMAHKAWGKIRELWVPMGNGTTIAGALVKIKYPSGGAASCTNSGGFVAGDYTPTTGLTGDGVGKYLSTGTTPSAIGMTANNVGFAVYSTTPNYNSGTTTVLGGATTNGSSYGYIGASGVAATSNFVTTSVGCSTASRMTFGQANLSTGYVETGTGSEIRAYAPLPASFLPTVQFTIFAHDNSAIKHFTSATICGYAIFDAMTTDELDMLSRFFDQINYGLGRNVFNGLVSVGDSITSGQGVTATQRWTYLVSQALGISEYNLGVNGSTMSVCPTLGIGGSANTYERWSPIVSTTAGGATTGSMYKALQYSGSIYTIHLGINDCAFSGNLASFNSAYRTFLSHFQSAGIPMSALYILGVTYGIESLSGVSQLNETTRAQYNAAISAIATEYGCNFVDVGALWGPSNSATYLQGDSLHPNSTGHAAIASSVLTKIYSTYPRTIKSFVGITNINK